MEDFESIITSNNSTPSDQEDIDFDFSELEHDEYEVKPEIPTKPKAKANQSNMSLGSRLITKWIEEEVLYSRLYLFTFAYHFHFLYWFSSIRFYIWFILLEFMVKIGPK